MQNTHRTGFLGLFIGGSTLILAAVGGLFKMLTRPQFLVDLYHAIRDVQAGHATSVDELAIAHVVAACIAIVGAFVLALLMTYYGRPYTIADNQSAPKP